MEWCTFASNIYFYTILGFKKKRKKKNHIFYNYVISFRFLHTIFCFNTFNNVWLPTKTDLHSFHSATKTPYPFVLRLVFLILNFSYMYVIYFIRFATLCIYMDCLCRPLSCSGLRRTWIRNLVFFADIYSLESEKKIILIRVIYLFFKKGVVVIFSCRTYFPIFKKNIIFLILFINLIGSLTTKPS